MLLSWHEHKQCPLHFPKYPGLEDKLYIHHNWTYCFNVIKTSRKTNSRQSKTLVCVSQTMDLVAVPSLHFVMLQVIVKSFRVTEAKTERGIDRFMSLKNLLCCFPYSWAFPGSPFLASNGSDFSVQVQLRRGRALPRSAYASPEADSDWSSLAHILLPFSPRKDGVLIG